MRLVNLTRATITVYDESGRDVVLNLPTDPPAVVALFRAEPAGTAVDDETGGAAVSVPIVRHRCEVDPESLPFPEDGVVFVVGRGVLEALAERGVRRLDLVAPDTDRDSAVRDSRGRVVGVRRFRY